MTTTKTSFRRYCVLFALGAGCGCSSSHDDSSVVIASAEVESCMSCHNGARHNDYSGSGLENPHPFNGAGTLTCTSCHGGHPLEGSRAASHIPPPPEVGDERNQIMNATAYFNKLTYTGLDKYADYVVDGVTYTALDFLQFLNPGDLRVTKVGRGCGACHLPHAQSVARAPLATEMGIMSGSMYTLGVDLTVPQSVGLYHETGSDLAFRAVTDPTFDPNSGVIGSVAEMHEFPVFSVFGGTGPLDIFRNNAYTAANLENSVNPDNSVIPNSPLANLFHEQVQFTCGDCHLGSAGQNNRYGDFRSSGCTSCHMRFSQDGRSHSTDPNIKKKEPRNPDAIQAPERPHVRRHLIESIARRLGTGETIRGIDDHACAGCHQGSNRTVLQYWGIRLDQNADVVRRVQYPANPRRFETTAADTRLYDPVVRNNTFNGRNPNQYILMEDYDDDHRDDTPADIHYEAGLGCIDCHGSHDIHGGTVGDPNDAKLLSHQEQAVAIRCENCHGTIDAYAPTMQGVMYDGRTKDLAYDAEGNVLKHVYRDTDGSYYLISRLDARIHFVPQTKDVVYDSGRRNPFTQELVYNAKASYAMGRADGDPTNGMGPLQANMSVSGFSHTDNMSCAACHAAWSNNCIGCHLKGEYNTGNNFSNITGERIVYKQTNADFTYQTPVPFQLGIDTHNRIAPSSPNTLVFYQYRDLNREFSRIFSFTDRNGCGNNGGVNGRNVHPALSHNAFMPHSIRGKVTSTNEGVRYCSACHLTVDGLNRYSTEYTAFRNAMAANDYAALNFDVLRDHIGRNTGNQMDSPLWVHMVVGLGSGLFLFNQEGCPVNPLDGNANRVGCNGVAPGPNFDPAQVALDLDRIVEASGVSNASNNHAYLEPGNGPSLRDGATDPDRPGPLGATLIRRLSDPATGIVLDAWINADGQLQGNASNYVTP